MEDWNDESSKLRVSNRIKSASGPDFHLMRLSHKTFSVLLETAHNTIKRRRIVAPARQARDLSGGNRRVDIVNLPAFSMHAYRNRRGLAHIGVFPHIGVLAQGCEKYRVPSDLRSYRTVIYRRLRTEFGDPKLCAKGLTARDGLCRHLALEIRDNSV